MPPACHMDYRDQNMGHKNYELEVYKFRCLRYSGYIQP
jgi:hypothetical protein